MTWTSIFQIWRWRTPEMQELWLKPSWLTCSFLATIHPRNRLLSWGETAIPLSARIMAAWDQGSWTLVDEAVRSLRFVCVKIFIYSWVWSKTSFQQLACHVSMKTSKSYCYLNMYITSMQEKNAQYFIILRQNSKVTC